MKIFKEILNRLKSPVVISTIAAEIATLIALISPRVGETIRVVLLSLTAILVAFGVLNNPSDRDNF